MVLSPNSSRVTYNSSKSNCQSNTDAFIPNNDILKEYDYIRVEVIFHVKRGFIDGGQIGRAYCNPVLVKCPQN